MRERLMQLITEPDNKTLCPVRIVAILGALEYLGLAAIKHGTVELQSFAIGFAALLGGVGAALGLKKDSPIPEAK